MYSSTNFDKTYYIDFIVKKKYIYTIMILNGANDVLGKIGNLIEIRKEANDKINEMYGRI